MYRSFLIKIDLAVYGMTYLKILMTPYTLPRIWQLSTIMGSMVSFSG